MIRPPLVPLRPQKHVNESIIGYCLRIAKVNHFSNADECIKSYYPNSIRLTHSMMQQFSIAKFVTYLTGREIAICDNDFIGRFSDPCQHYNEDKLSISDKPSICTQCIKQHGYIKSEWQYVLNSYCNEHQCSHINVCPHCERELQWNVALLNLKCQRCGENLTSPATAEPLHIINQKNKDRNERKHYQKELLETAKLLVRPFDFMTTKISVRPVMIKNWNTLLELAALHIEQNLGIPDAYMLRDTENLNDKYTDFTLSLIVHGTSLRDQEKPTSEKARDLLDNKALEKWFGIQECHIYLCLSLELIKPVLKKNYVTPIYDYQDLRNIFSSLKVLRGEGHSISSVANEAPLFWCQPRDIITGILTRKISVRFKHPSRPSFHDAWIDRSEALQYFDSRRTLLNTQVISEDVAFEVFAGPKNIWDKMLQSDLETYPTNSSKKMVATKSLQNALSKLHLTKSDIVNK
jgi:hypothetical protein